MGNKQVQIKTSRLGRQQSSASSRGQGLSKRNWRFTSMAGIVSETAEIPGKVKNPMPQKITFQSYATATYCPSLQCFPSRSPST